jgi:hypothetical protein
MSEAASSRAKKTPSQKPKGRIEGVFSRVAAGDPWFTL